MEVQQTQSADLHVLWVTTVAKDRNRELRLDSMCEHCSSRAGAVGQCHQLTHSVPKHRVSGKEREGGLQ